MLQFQTEMGCVSIDFEINFRTFVGPQFCMLGIGTLFKPRSHFERVRVPLLAIPPPYDVLRALAPYTQRLQILAAFLMEHLFGAFAGLTSGLGGWC